MATYYVRTDGSDSNAGTGPATNQAWQTITKAIGASGIAPGDTLYIAPGIYRGNFTAGFTNPANEGQRISIIGNPTASEFTGVSSSPVIITNYISNTAPSGITFNCTKDFVSVSNIHFVGYQLGGSPAFGQVTLFNGTYTICRNCGFFSPASATESYQYEFTVNIGSRGPTIERCVFFGHTSIRSNQNTGSAYDSQTLVRECLLMNQNTNSTVNGALMVNTFGTSAIFGGIKVINCRLQAQIGIRQFPAYRLSTTFPLLAQNCIFDCATGISSNNTGDIVESYNLFNSATALVNVTAGTGSLTRTFFSPDYSLSRITGWSNLPFHANHFTSTTQNAGINTNSDTNDFYGVTWLAPSTPTMGPVEYFSNSNTGAYLPTERNASTITIAPGSTSQSIELYLGATGLAFNTSGLQAYYIRNRSAPVAITLVTQTATGDWTSGGFAQISSSLTPGVYRLDVPDAALAAGADDVTIVVRGASGTNGAVMTIKLSSGGLTAAQTAAAVWDEPYASHTTAATFGSRTLKTVADNRLVNVGTANHIEANVHAIVDSGPAASELSGALLHNGTDYISAELLSPVSAATSVHIGPYQLLADGLGADQPLDVNVGTATSIDVQVTDANGTGIDITGATVTAKVYNSGGTLVATYAGTATYADNGRLSFGLTTTVTATSGTYTVTVTRTTGATDTQVFGPLRLYVRPV